MPTGDNSSINKIAETLQDIRRRRTLVRLLNTDRDAVEIAGCVQKLKQFVDSFLVCHPVIVIYFSSSQTLESGGDHADDREKS